MKIWVTGDPHRDFDRIREFCEKEKTTREDILVILGDSAVNYYADGRDAVLKEELKDIPVTMLHLHGNHERRPWTVPGYTVREWHGGKVWVEERYPNLLFAMDGEFFDLGGKQYMVIGGANSSAKAELIPGVSWWEDEEPSEEIKSKTERRLAEAGWKADGVFSHATPAKFLDGGGDNPTERWLDALEDRLDYGIWYCGHHHRDRDSGKMIFLYHEFREL